MKTRATDDDTEYRSFGISTTEFEAEMDRLGRLYGSADFIEVDQVSRSSIMQPALALISRVPKGVNGGEKVCQMAARKCTSQVERKGL